MKKVVGQKGPAESTGSGSDVVALIHRMQEDIRSLDRKIDRLIGRAFSRQSEAGSAEPAGSTVRLVEARHFPLPTRRYDQPQPQPQAERAQHQPHQQRHQHQAQGAPQGNGFRQRVMHKAVCADCNTACEVPFKPTDGRPVYCKECFARRKANSPFKPRHDHGKPGAAESVQAPRQPEKASAGQARKAAARGAAKTASKTAARKQPAVKKRKGKK